MNETIIWDEEKNKANIKKHGVSMSEAATVFEDVNTRYFNDEKHSTAAEQRFTAIGMSEKLNVLVVCHCYRCEETVIRIISARKAGKREETLYLYGGEML